jgi:hypothetical protein
MYEHRQTVSEPRQIYLGSYLGLYLSLCRHVCPYLCLSSLMEGFCKNRTTEVLTHKKQIRSFISLRCIYI